MALRNCCIQSASTELPGEELETKEPIDDFDTIDVPQVTKKSLMALQNFCPAQLSSECGNHMTAIRRLGYQYQFFPYSNDATFIKTYTQDFIDLCHTKTRSVEFSKTCHSVLFNPLLPQFSILIGNSNVLSFCPEIPSDNILLIDRDPAVLYFVFKIRGFILSASEIDVFEIIKDKIISQIIALEETLRLHNKKLEDRITKSSILTLEKEMKALGKYHFLASEERFKQCKSALMKTHIFPIHGNFFDESLMDKISKILKVHGKVVFVNLTNVLEYKRSNENFMKILDQLPLTEECKFIFTILLDDIGDRKKFTAIGKEDLKRQLHENMRSATYTNSSCNIL